MTVLTAIGEDEKESRVVPVARDLARAHGDDLVALHVIPTEDFEEYREALEQFDEFADYSISQEVGKATRFARDVVEATLGEFDPETVSVEGRVGDPVDEILDAAGEFDARYLVIGGSRRSPAGKAVFGSTTQSILLNATVPVMTVMGGQ